MIFNVTAICNTTGKPHSLVSKAISRQFALFLFTVHYGKEFSDFQVETL